MILRGVCVTTPRDGRIAAVGLRVFPCDNEPGSRPLSAGARFVEEWRPA